MPESLEQALGGAIGERRVVRFFYAGTAPSRRTVEPHILGADAAGVALLSGWQIGGGSGEGWRNFHLSEIAGLQVTDRTFAGPRDGYNPDDHAFSTVDARL